jgi:tRNA 2-thiouridine synthesizing protein E
MMENKKAPNLMPELDEEGFLVDTNKWTREVAQILAQQEEEPVGLTEEHWRVIDFMRQFYLEYGSPPSVRMIPRHTGISLRRIRELFPEGLTKSACKYAGLPRIAIRPNFLYP